MDRPPQPLNLDAAPEGAPNDLPKSPTSSQPVDAKSCLTFSSVSSDDSLPLGCEHREYFWIKRYRALKRRVNTARKPQSLEVVEEDHEVGTARIVAVVGSGGGGRRRGSR